MVKKQFNLISQTEMPMTLKKINDFLCQQTRAHNCVHLSLSLSYQILQPED